MATLRQQLDIAAAAHMELQKEIDVRRLTSLADVMLDSTASPHFLHQVHVIHPNTSVCPLCPRSRSGCAVNKNVKYRSYTGEHTLR